jgi:hypothetical protein
METPMVEIEAKAGDDICDFCSEPKPSHLFSVSDFTMDQTPGLPEYRSKGGWAACSSCAALIEAENWDGLALRGLNKLQSKYSMLPRRILADTVRRSHDLFRAHYRKQP